MSKSEKIASALSLAVLFIGAYFLVTIAFTRVLVALSLTDIFESRLYWIIAIGFAILGAALGGKYGVYGAIQKINRRFVLLNGGGFCANCGYEYNKVDVVCGNCGVKVNC